MTIEMTYEIETKDRYNIRFHGGRRIVKGYPAKVIVEKVCEYFDLPQNVVLAGKRKRELVNCRRFIMRFLKDYTELTLAQIGKWAGHKDHTTVIHALHTLSDLMETEDQTRHDYLEIKKLFL